MNKTDLKACHGCGEFVQVSKLRRCKHCGAILCPSCRKKHHCQVSEEYKKSHGLFKKQKKIKIADGEAVVMHSASKNTTKTTTINNTNNRDNSRVNSANLREETIFTQNKNTGQLSYNSERRPNPQCTILISDMRIYELARTPSLMTKEEEIIIYSNPDYLRRFEHYRTIIKTKGN